MTPYELMLKSEVFVEMKQRELEEKITYVWMAEYYHRIKTLPPLKEVLDKLTAKEKKEMTQEQMLEQVKMLNARFGGVIESTELKVGE
jgi:hypothetical protein